MGSTPPARPASLNWSLPLVREARERQPWRTTRMKFREMLETSREAYFPCPGCWGDHPHLKCSRTHVQVVHAHEHIRTRHGRTHGRPAGHTDSNAHQDAHTHTVRRPCISELGSSSARRSICHRYISAPFLRRGPVFGLFAPRRSPSLF